jgi:hypothetical protein
LSEAGETTEAAAGPAATAGGRRDGAAAATTTSDPIAALRDPATIRLRCAAVTRAVAEGRSAWFTLDRTRLDDVARRVAALTRERFATLAIPVHSRWRHFEAGGIDRKGELDVLLAGRSAADAARARIDLTVVSVLLDAGAGAKWSYAEPGGQAYTRSEGLGVATFRAFAGGRFSATGGDPLRADAAALAACDAALLREVFQAGADNPLVGLEGRAALLQRLGDLLRAGAAVEGTEAHAARPGRLFDRLTQDGTCTEITAAALLRELVTRYAPIWTSGSRVLGLPAGDVWPHHWAGAAAGARANAATTGWVPFHKLSQWLAYSLIEPFAWAGVRVTGLDALTGLPEYRNGGLLLDCGVIVPRDPRDLQRTWKPRDEFVVEWRALTVTLLDEVAELVRALLHLDAARLPLACVLEGGTWAAGRQIAQELRGGAPPVKIDSDGTVF